MSHYEILGKCVKTLLTITERDTACLSLSILSLAVFFIDGTGTSYGKNIVLRLPNVLLIADVHETRNLRFKVRGRIRIADCKKEPNSPLKDKRMALTSV